MRNTKLSSPIFPVVLCGGSGSRLWPLSRRAFPKQFSSFIEDASLFQSTALRFSGAEFADPVVITGDDFRFVVQEQLRDAGVEATDILIEPSPKDTAPAVLAAATWLERRSGDALILATPSDHLVVAPDALIQAVKKARPEAENGKIVTFGIRPTRPETGYGWIEFDECVGVAEDVKPIARFVEKPELGVAEQFLQSGRHFWNSGIFLFSVSTISKAFADHAPDLLSGVRDAVSDAEPDLDFLRLDESAWNRLRSVSVDYAIMERASDIVGVECDCGWSDLGDWQSIWRLLERDGAGVSVSGSVTYVDCRNSHLRSTVPEQRLVAIGCSDIVAVAMPDAVLVADRNSSQLVKPAVARLLEDGVPQADRFPEDRRPWGQFKSLAVGDRFQVKRIVVNPRSKLSLQSHKKRSEHWIVVEGTAKVTIGSTVKLIGENESIYVPLGEKHRLENPDDQPLVLIEVQTGSYFGEDDIVRYEDDYARLNKESSAQSR